MEPAEKQLRLQRIRHARGKFVAMAATYCLGVFNDSFFRESVMLIAVAIGRKHLQGWVMVIFTLPYLLFAAPAGWLADRFSKRHVVIGAKALELVAMIFGAVGICTGSWPLILAMVFLMGWQSAIFSPSLNGSIPELYPRDYVPTANAILKVVVTASILGGVACSGITLGNKVDGNLWGVPFNRLIVAAVLVGVSAFGLLWSFGVPKSKPADPTVAFPWAGPLKTLQELRKIASDRMLAIVVVANTFAWTIGSFLILTIHVLAMEQLGLNESWAGYMVASELVGIAVGGMVARRVTRLARWYRVLPAMAFAMFVFMAIMTAVPWLSAGVQLPAIFILLALIGVAGGLFLIPCEAFIQVRPPATERGAVLSAANFCVFSGVLLSGLVSNGLNSIISPTNCFGLFAVAALVVGAWLLWAVGKYGDSAGFNGQADTVQGNSND